MRQKIPHGPSPRKGGRVASSVALTAAVILIFLGLNVLAGLLEKRYALSADWSFNALTMQSAVTEESLKALDRPVEMYMVTVGMADTVGDSTLLRRDLLTVLERYRAMNGQLRLYEENLLSHPTWAKRFTELLNGEAVTTDGVMIFCEDTQRARWLTAEDFVSYQYDLDNDRFVISAYAIEKALTEAIVYVSAARTPVAQLLTGHGELTAAETDVLEQHLNAAGYQVERVTLHGADSLDPLQPLLILCPRFDLTAEEAGWIGEYLLAGGGLICVCGYDSPVDLPRLNALLGEFGLSFRPGIVVASGEDPTSYYSDSPATLLPYMQAAPETQALLANGQEILVMPGARAVQVAEDRDIRVYAQALLRSGDAYLRLFEDGATTLDRQEGDPSGQFDLAALARRYDEDTVTGTVLVIGCDAMFTEDWVYDNTYQDAFLRALLRTAGQEKPISLDINVKSAARPGLSLGSVTPAVLACAVLPLLVVAAALLVLMPRRHL